MSAHTPGPWKIGRSFPRKLPFWISAEDGTPILNSRAFSRFTTETAEANARLIAAAPELLQALKDMTYDADGVANCYPTQERVMALIAKAEGKP